MSRNRVSSRARLKRLGQNFITDTNLLDAIVRDSGVGPEDVVLEVGAGEGSLTARLAPVVSHVHVIEIDRRLEPVLDEVYAPIANVELHWGDALDADLGSLGPAPTAMVANLPYSVATPVIMRTIFELPQIRSWTVMVQREIAERLGAAVGSRSYGSPSALAQLACEVRTVRKVDRSVFVPRPNVDSAVIRLVRRSPRLPDPWTRRVVRAAFAHRRKALPRSLASEFGPAGRELAREALCAIGLDERARAQELEPLQLADLAARIRAPLNPTGGDDPGAAGG